MRCHTFCEEADSSGLILKIDSKYNSNSSTGCEYPKEFRELQNDYPLTSVEPKKEMLSEQQLMTDFYKLPFSNVKKLKANFFVKEKYVLHYGSWHFF